MRNHTPLAYLTEVSQTHAHPPYIKEAIIIPMPAPPEADIMAIA